MANRDIVAIGTSAGGIEALLFLAKGFRENFPASILVTIHLPSQFPSLLDGILTRAGSLTATFASEGEVMKKARIYIAPPGRHLLVDNQRLWLGEGPRENGARPAIDPMLRSIAACCGNRTVGVVLTGTLGDGASGLWALSKTGGVTVVQDPSDAAFPEMPRSALNRLHPDHVVHLKNIPALLDSLVQQPAGDPAPVPDNIPYEVEVARSGRGSMNDMDRFGRRSVLACPDCGGVMWELNEGKLSRYRCHVGHAYTAELMMTGIDDSLRRAMASAQRALEERTALLRKLHDEAADNGRAELAKSWYCRMQEFQKEAEVIRNAMKRLNGAAAQPVGT
jgi:two-component system, chemotaxis family, protein-glutamate methylesterase/glutaminase